MPKAIEPLIEMALVKALGHEVRQEILYRIARKPTPEMVEQAKAEGAPLPRKDEDGLLPQSPNKLSEYLDEGLSQVSYHIKVLKDYKIIHQVATRPRRGAVEHYYLPTKLTRTRLMALASIGPEVGAVEPKERKPKKKGKAKKKSKGGDGDAK